MKLNPMPPARILPGSKIVLDGNDIVNASEKEMQKIRGNAVSMIFQDPMTCLNPTMQVGKQLTEAIREHKNLTKRRGKKRSNSFIRVSSYPKSRTACKTIST